MDKETSVTARRFAEAVRHRVMIKRILLFGSRARGDHFVTSDYDFIIVSDDFKGVPFVERAAPLYECWDATVDMEALCYTVDEWRRLKDKRGILLNAQRDGVEIA